MRVLLVEDDVVHAKMVRRAVREFASAIEIVHVPDGESAAGALASRTDLVLLDLRLPGMDGVEVLRMIRADPATSAIPVVVISTSDRREEIERCYGHGANAYVCKPLEYDEMIRRLRMLAGYWLSMTLSGPEERAA